MLETPAVTTTGTTASGAQIAGRRGAFIGSCKHRVWEAIRASSAAPYYLDDFSDGNRFLFPNMFFFNLTLNSYNSCA